MHARDERTDRRREAEARAHLFRARRLARNDFARNDSQTSGQTGAEDAAAPPRPPGGYAGPEAKEAVGSGSPLERATQRTPASR